MRNPSHMLSILVVGFCLACGGAADVETTVVQAPPVKPDVVEAPPAEPASTKGVSVGRGGVTDLSMPYADKSTLQIIGVADDAVAGKLIYTKSVRAGSCNYAGMEANQGVILFLAKGGELEKWTVYESPHADDAPCTSDDDAVAALGAAKKAMKAAGIDAACPC